MFYELRQYTAPKTVCTLWTYYVYYVNHVYQGSDVLSIVTRMLKKKTQQQQQM